MFRAIRQQAQSIWVLLTLLACGCQTRPLSPTKIISSINDTIYFKNVFQLSITGSEINFNDYDNGRILIVDKNFNLSRIIGRKGKLIGELIDPNYYFIQDSIISIAGNIKGGFNSYNYYNGEFIGETRGLTSDPILSKFIIHDSLIYISAPSSDNPMSSFNLRSELKNSFGMFFPYLNDSEKAVRNDRHLIHANDSSFFSIGISEPIIQFYSYTGNLKYDYNFSDLEIVAKRIQSIQKLRAANSDAYKTTYVLTTYAHIHDDKLFLLIASNKGEKGLCSEDILVFEFNEKELNYKRSLDLSSENKKWYTTFSLDARQLIAFENYDAQIHVFDINIE